MEWLIPLVRDIDWCAAACADALVADLSIESLQCAHEVAETPEQFFWAVSASIWLDEMVYGVVYDEEGDRE